MSIEILAGIVVFCSLAIFGAVWRRPGHSRVDFAQLVAELADLQADLEEHRRESRLRSAALERQIAELVAQTPRRWAGRYELIHLLGEGGVGRVWFAKDLQLSRAVAVKILRSELGDDERTRRRFRREAQTAAQIIHPNVVQVYDYGEHDGHLYLVMQRLRGVTLRDVMPQSAPATEDMTRHVAADVASALVESHAVKLVHRDIKPENICKERDRYVVVDFGLAFVASPTSEMSRATEDGVSGTPHYMSPEQFREQELDPKADIYALGCVLYELLTGRPPFERRSWVAMGQDHTTSSPDMVGVPHEWSGLIAAMLQKNPVDRPTAVQVLEAIEVADDDIDFEIVDTLTEFS